MSARCQQVGVHAARGSRRRRGGARREALQGNAGQPGEKEIRPRLRVAGRQIRLHPSPGRDGALEPRWQQLPSRPVRSLLAGAPQPEIPEIVIVPGLGALGYLEPWVHACSSWTRVHLLDLPGFGDRRTSHCPAGLADVSDTVAMWLQAVPTGTVVLVGHSTGAQAALRAAAVVAPRLRAVVLAGPTFPPEARHWGPLLVRVARTLRHESPREVRATFPEYLKGRRRVVTLLRSAMADEPEAVVPQLRCPVVVMRGQNDALSSAPWAARLADAAPCGRVVTVPGAHNFTFTDPQAASTALRDALDTVWGQRRTEAD